MRDAITYHRSSKPSALTDMGLEAMQRYLIHHDDGGTWDLVVDGDVWAVEHLQFNKRQTFELAAFQQSEHGERLARQLSDALARAVTS